MDTGITDLRILCLALLHVRVGVDGKVRQPQETCVHRLSIEFPRPRRIPPIKYVWCGANEVLVADYTRHSESH